MDAVMADMLRAIAELTGGKAGQGKVPLSGRQARDAKRSTRPAWLSR